MASAPRAIMAIRPDKYLELFTIEPGIRFAQALLEKLFGEKMKKERERNHAF